MSGAYSWKPVYLPVSREAFEAAARKARVPRRDRDRVYAWIQQVEAQSHRVAVGFPR